MSITEEAIIAKAPLLQQEFLKKFEESIKNGSYDERDLERLKADEVYSQCVMRSFHEVKDPDNLEKPVNQIDTIFKFRKQIKIHELTPESFPAEMKERNFLYWKGVDKQGQKILHFVVAKHKKGHLVQEAKNYISMFLEEHHKANLGKRIVLIFDFTNAGLTNMDLDVVKFIITSLSNYFPCILAYILLFEMPWLLSSIWKIIRSWLSEEQKQKITLVNKSEIQKHIDACELEPHMVK